MDEVFNPVEKNKFCLNCGAELAGKYCSFCGQKDLPRRQNIGDLILNFVGSFTSFESKFFRTFSVLLFHPGRIVKDYNAGKRDSYYHPARMYVFLSFIFFLLLSVIQDEATIDMTVDGNVVTTEEGLAALDTASRASFELKTMEEYDSIEATKPPEKRTGKLGRYIAKKFILLRATQGGDNKAVIKKFAGSFRENTPKMIFLLLPVFAFILKLLYVRRDFYYSEHLVFSVFFYDFLYIAGAVELLFSLVSWLDWMNIIVFLLIMFYLYKSMRIVYGQPRGKTILKFTLLLCTFSFVVLLALVVNVIITFVLL